MSDNRSVFAPNINSYDAAARHPVAVAGSWRLGSILDGIAQSEPHATALVIGEERRRISYSTLMDVLVECCATLRRRGLLPGDVVALESTNTVTFVIGLLAAARAGLVVAPLDPALPVLERRTRLDMIGARVTLTDIECLHGRDSKDHPDSVLQKTDCGSPHCGLATRLVVTDPARVLPGPVPGLTVDDALIMFTSGTTGTPKMVPWTHGNIAAAIRGVNATYRLGPDDATVAVMPLFHGHGLIAALLATLATGGRLLLPARGRFSKHTFWDDVAAVDATWYTAVPTIYEILLNSASAELRGGHHGRLRFIRSCSAPLPPATVRQIEATFNAPVLPAYGLTEATHQASAVLPSDDEFTRLTSVGAPTGAAVRIVDPSGHTCPVGETGEVWLRGPTVVRGYLNNAAATAATFAGGWLHTGDLGAVDSHGNLAIKGRIKNLINRGGEKISPERVEEVLASHPGVAQAVVIGVPDALYGERVAAAIVPRKGAHVESGDLMSYVRDRLAAFEVPEHVVFVDKLPLTVKGSVPRNKIARLFSSQQTGGTP